MILGPGTIYEMSDPNGWHPVYTLMITEKPWLHAKQLSPKTPTSSPLPDDEKLALFNKFKGLFKKELL